MYSRKITLCVGILRMDSCQFIYLFIFTKFTRRERRKKGRENTKKILKQIYALKLETVDMC